MAQFSWLFGGGIEAGGPGRQDLGGATHPSFTEGNLGPGQAGDLTQVILVSGIAKTRVGSFTSSPRVLSGNY